MGKTTTPGRLCINVHVYPGEDGLIHLQINGRLTGVSPELLGRLIGAQVGAIEILQRRAADAVRRKGGDLASFWAAFGLARSGALDEATKGSDDGRPSRED